MITPRFSLSQDEKFLTINIHAPYCHIRELEIYLNENDFRFFCSPYYLRLHLPGRLVDDDEAKGELMSDSGVFVLKYRKEVFGEHFDRLDLITSLLSKIETKDRRKVPFISEIKVPSEGSSSGCLPTNSGSVSSEYGYGFAQQKCNILRSDTEDEFYNVFDIRNIEQTTIGERKERKFKKELSDFSIEHYLADLHDDGEIQEIIGAKCVWLDLEQENVALDDHERDILKDLPNKEHLLDSAERQSAWYSLLDVLFAYAYDQRTTAFEGTCESGWTLTKLSATLACLHRFETLHQTICSAYRRSIIYPLYRNFQLSSKVFNDFKILLSLGRVFVVKCLIRIYNTFNESAEPRYILNELFIKDYLIFVQNCSGEDFKQISLQVEQIHIGKSDLDLPLDETEQDDIITKITHLQISSKDSDSDDESDDSSEDDVQESDAN